MHNPEADHDIKDLHEKLRRAQSALSYLKGELQKANEKIDSVRQSATDLHYFRALLESAPDPSMLLTEHGHIQYANEAMCTASGLDSAELLGLRVAEVLPGISFEEIKRQLRDRDHCEPMESGILHPTQSSLAVEIHIRKIQLEGSSAIFITARDMREARIIQRDLRLFGSAIEVSLNGITIASAKGDKPLIMANKAFTELTGYTEQEIIGRNCRFLQGPETRAEDIEAIRSALQKHRAIRLTIKNYRKDGTSFWNDLSINPIRSVRGEVTHFVALQVDVTAAIEERDQSARTAATMRSLLNSTADGFFGLDLEGKCTFCNQGALEMLGYDSDADVLDVRMHELLHHHYPNGTEYPAAECPIYHSMASGKSIARDDEVFWRKDGTPFPVEYTSDPIIKDDEIKGCVVAFRDISGMLRVQAEIELKKDQAESANRAKAEFIANMSHEIRTPLTAIMAYTDLLTHQLTEEASIRHSRAIKRNADHLLSIINDILDMSKTDANQLEVESQTVSVSGLLADIESLMDVRATEKGLALHFKYANSVPSAFYADEKRVRQILLNLLSNAIKFTDIGSVTVSVGWQKGEIYFSVEDTGIGISDSDQERLFEPFEQANAQITTQYGGTGLGLSISRRLAEQMGGRIELAAQPHQGSCFTLYLPCPDAPSGHKAEFSRRHSSGSVRPDSEQQNLGDITIEGNILIVDDLPEVQESIKEILEICGAQIHVASDGQRAIDAITLGSTSVQKVYDAILMDMNMPVKDGFEAVRELRSLGYTGRIIAVTAGVLGSEREACLQAGCDDYLSKPFSAKALLAKLQPLLRKPTDSSIDATKAPTKNATKPPTRSPMKAPNRHVLIVDDYADVAHSVAEILGTQGVRCETATSGDLALKVIETFTPDLCLLDINMPGMNGIELLRKLRAHPRARKAVFAAITGETSAERAKELLDMGFSHHLTKPIDINRLIEIVASIDTA